MNLPQHILDRIRTDVTRNARGMSPSESLCINLGDRLVKALEAYFEKNPGEARKAAVSFFQGDKDTVRRTIELISDSYMSELCGDILCLGCRRERIMNRVIGTPDPRLEDLKKTAAFLGDEVMRSMKWLTKILIGTIDSKRSSAGHREKAKFALHTTIPLVALNATLVDSLQKDLAEAVEARDKYRKLADMLMDEESAPASSE